MTNKNFEVIVDFGSSTIRGAAFNKNNVSKNFVFESKVHSNNENLENEVEKIIIDLEKSTSEYINNVYVMVDSPEMISINLSISKNLDGSNLQKEDVQFLIQVKLSHGKLSPVRLS